MLAAIAAVLMLASSCGSDKGALDSSQQVPEQSTPQFQLPDVSSLDDSGNVQRRTSASQVELLSGVPIDAATGNAAELPTVDSTLALSPQSAEGFAWAIYGLSGFPEEGTILPTHLHRISNAQIWIAVADYSTGRWQYPFEAASGEQFAPLPDPASMISPAGHVYIAVIAADSEAVLTKLELYLSGDPGGDPVAMLNLNTEGTVQEESSVSFDALGSIAGTAPLNTFVYDFGDGSQPLITDSADTEVMHTFASEGDYTVSLTVADTEGRVAKDTMQLEVAGTVRDLLVIYNSSIPEDTDLAEYYMSPETGRSINPAYKLGLPLADSENLSQQITRTYFEDNIRTPVMQFFAEPENSSIAADVKYLLLMKGIPHKIEGASEFSTTESTYSSVDSELCIINSYDEIPIKSWISNGVVDALQTSFYTTGAGHNARQFCLLGDGDFQRGSFDVTDGTTIWPLDYLVGRLSAYTYDEAKAIIDRSLLAERAGTDWVVFDSTTGGNRNTLDTMVDPVWPFSTDGTDSGGELLSAAGINTFSDISSERFISTSENLPENFVNSLIGYAGWGVNHTGGSWPSGNEYILNDLGWIYVPGACFMSYESFNGSDFDDSDGIQRRGQGQIADFLRKGGTVAIGNAWEPYTIGVGDERWVFDRYLNHGDRWIEAAYKGLRLLSWQEVVVGDPLCTMPLAQQ